MKIRKEVGCYSEELYLNNIEIKDKPLLLEITLKIINNMDEESLKSFILENIEYLDGTVTNDDVCGQCGNYNYTFTTIEI